MNDHARATANTDGMRIRGDGYTAEAGWFGPEDRPRFGWLYRPDTPAPNRVGMVIVPPFGFEAICAHRTLRHLAEDTAKAGCFALRFDLDGAGDSAGDDTDPDRVNAWIASIHDACNLARSVGAESLVLIGVRLGATLATLAAPQRRDVTAIVAINAVVRGRDFLREARVLQAAMGLRPSPEPQPDDGSQEVNGFLIAATTRAEIGNIDLAKCTDAPAPAVLLIERDDMPERTAWPDHLRELGVEVSLRRLPGYEPMMRDPMSNAVAQAIVDACVDFALHAQAIESTDLCPEVALRADTNINEFGATVIEQTTTNEDGMFGIITRPADRVAERGTILLLTIGALVHVGSNRMYVPLARELARTGYLVVRVDLSGIGESKPRTAAAENLSYGPHSIEDVSRWVAWARDQGTKEVITLGVCSGGYHSLRAAIHGQHIDSLLLVNPAMLRYSDNVNVIHVDLPTLNDVQHYRRSFKSVAAWKKLLRGGAAYRGIIKTVAWHVQAVIARQSKNLARRFGIPLRNDFGQALQSIARQGTRVHFLFSADDHGRALLAIETGNVVPRLCKAGKFSMRLFDGPDHTFTQLWAQAKLHDALLGILAPPHK